MKLTPANPNFEADTRASHQAQYRMRTMNMELTHVGPGEVDVELPYDLGLCESGGGLHGGTICSGLDTVCASAAASLTAADQSVLTAELKVNFLRRGLGDRFRFEGRVIKPGRTLIFTEGKCWGITGTDEKLVATISATMMVMTGGAKKA